MPALSACWTRPWLQVLLGGLALHAPGKAWDEWKEKVAEQGRRGEIGKKVGGGRKKNVGRRR